MATEHMRDGVTRAIRRGTHHGVVFRVGTPGRLAGRCLWPSLSSRKSKATGVVAVPFSSISPLHHLLRFFTFLLLLLFFFFRFSLSFSIYVLSCCYFLRFLFLSHFRAVLAGLYVFKFLLRCVRYRAYMRGCRKAASETVHVSKQQKTSESVAVPAIRCSDSIPEILFVVYIF